MRRLLHQSVAQPPATHIVADDDHDLKLFVLSFTAFFISIYSLIL